MKLDEAEREIFDQIKNKFTKEFGVGTAYAVYRLHREFANKLGKTVFPSREFRDSLLYDELSSSRFNGISIHQIFLMLKDEIGICERTFYSFYHNYYIPRRKEERKQNLLK